MNRIVKYGQTIDCKKECFRFALSYVDPSFYTYTLLDLGDAAALVVGNLAFVGFIGAIVIHGARPKAVIDFVTGQLKGHLIIFLRFFLRGWFL